jgi:Na+/melibiose symporter-like transporter
LRSLRAADYVSISVYWFALSYLWNSIHPLILPTLVPALAPAGLKGSALGIMISVGLLLAVVVQPLAGAISDRTSCRWGRRRPFILGGTLFDLLFLLVLAAAGNYWVLLGAYLLLQISSNAAQGPYQGLIPDLVPQGRRGAAAGAKQLAEILGVVVTAVVTAYFVGQGQLILALATICALLLATMLVTVATIRDRPGEGSFPTTLALRRPQGLSHGYLWLLTSRLLVLLGMNLIRNFALYFMEDILRIPNAAAATGSLLAVIAMVILVVAYPAGHLSDRIGRKRMCVFSAVLGAAGSFLLLFATGRVVLSIGGLHFTDVLVYGSIIGFSAGIYLSANWALATDLIPQKEAAGWLGISNLATAGAGVLAGLGGPLIDFFNARGPGLGYTALFLLSGVAYLLGASVLFGIRGGAGTA